MGVFVIAEAGVNHNGDRDMAFALVDAAAEAGADAVKFQTFRAEDLASRSAPKAAYQKTTTDAAHSQLEMLRGLELPRDLHFEIKTHCQTRSIQFLSTAFDSDSLAFLIGDVGLELLKIPSGEITNGPLLLQAAISRKPLILSTGMATIAEIAEALGVLAFGYLDIPEAPSRDAFGSAWESAAGRQALCERVTLLHCTTAYPTPIADVNLRAMATMAETFGLKVGYSDHTQGVTIPVAAAAMGATVIEKHFTLDRTLPGPDHQASLEPAELNAMVEAIRNVEAALGSADKQPVASEIENMAVARKSLVTLKAIASGEKFSPRNLGVKRPGTGRSPMDYWTWLDRPAERDYAEGELP